MVQNWRDRLQGIVGRAGYEIRRKPSFEIEMYRRLYGDDSVDNRRFYNIGAGVFHHPAWTAIDHGSDWYGAAPMDIDWDLLSLTPMPVEPGTAETTYCSHVIEHITNDAAANLFSECHRILKPGGYARFVTPNIWLHYEAWRANDLSHFYWREWYNTPAEMQNIHIVRPMREASAAQLFVYQFASAASTLHADERVQKVSDEELEELFQQLPFEEALDQVVSRCRVDVQQEFTGNHINWWTTEKLVHMLKEAGFETVYRSGWGQSLCPAMRQTGFFDTTHPPISLFVEARR